MLYFISDLDKTLIYSKNQAEKVVETIEGRPVTTMTGQAFEMMRELLSKDDITFIPCTLRTYEQTARVCFCNPEDLEFMICENGASIYINGKKDMEWDRHIQALLPEDNTEQLHRVCTDLLRQHMSMDKIKIRKLNNNYIYIVCEDVDKARQVYNILQEIPANAVAGISGRKVYIIPPGIDKKYAVGYIKDVYKIPDAAIITAGDSFADIQFLPTGHAAIAPLHADAAVRDVATHITKERDAKAAEEILGYVLQKGG